MKNHLLLGCLAILLLATSCQRKTYVFEVNDQLINTDQINKENFKAELTLLENAWTDLFNANMPGYIQSQVVTDLNSIGDKIVIVDRVLRHMLNRTEANLPANAAMRADLEGFVNNSYLKFYHRQPSPIELFKIKQLIEDDQAFRPEHLWMAILTSNEYSRN
jgi:hypothetical protein